MNQATQHINGTNLAPIQAIDRKTLAATLNIAQSTVHALLKKHPRIANRNFVEVIPRKDGLNGKGFTTYSQAIVDDLKPFLNKPKGRKPNKAKGQTKAASLTAPAKVKELAVELIQQGFADAGVYLINRYVKS